MGYVPDPALGRLNAYRRGAGNPKSHSVLAWINLWEDPKRLYENPTYQQYREGSEEQAKSLGYKIEEFCPGKANLTISRLIDILRNRGITGLLLPPVRHTGISNLELPWDSFSTVRFGHSASYISTHVVGSAQFQTAFDAVTILFKRGLRSIGFVFYSDEESKTVSNFLGGYLAAFHKNKEDLKIPPLIFKQPQLEKSRIQFMEWYFENRPEVIFVQDAFIYNWLIQAGLKIPDDVKLVHLALPVGGKVKFSGMHQDSRMIGSQAVSFLDRLIRHNERGIPETPVEVLINSHWIDGETC